MALKSVGYCGYLILLSSVEVLLVLTHSFKRHSCGISFLSNGALLANVLSIKKIYFNSKFVACKPREIHINLYLSQ